MIIRKDFLVDDLKEFIECKTSTSSIYQELIKAYNEIACTLQESEVEDCPILYNMYDSNDLINAITLDNATIEDFHSIVVDSNKEEEDASTYFYSNIGDFTLLTNKLLRELLSKHIEQIAVNILLTPYREPYCRLYQTFVKPMVEQQM
jgi:hypothetical protein